MQPKNTIRYLVSQGVYPSFEKRFWSRVRKAKSCWIWIGKPDSVGYGMIGKGPHQGGYIRSHRASWILNRGPIPKGKDVLHDCPGGDNKMCVNPDHLYIGSDTENGFDRKRKCQIAKGEAHSNTHLKNRDVARIRASRLTQMVLAGMYTVTQSEISRIKNHKRWV